VLLRINGSSFSGAAFLPGKGVTSLNATDRHRALLGTDLTVDDLMADFLDWPQQTITGEEMLETVPCAVVESRQASAKVKNWVDKKRYVTLKAEIYPTGGSTPLRTVHSIEARRSDSGFYVPVKFSVSTTATGTTTRVVGTGYEDSIPYTDADFTEVAMQQVTPAPAKK
jgi:Outer membrane lipoprotein-sorting protein